MALKIMLKTVRGSFLVLGEPEQYEGKGPFRWSATALVPYDSPQRKMVEDALKQVAIDQWGAKGAAIYEAIMAQPKSCCWNDGKLKPEYDGYEGHFSLTAHRAQEKGRPIVKDNDTSPIYTPTNELYAGKAGRIYSGCYLNFQCELWAQNNKHGKGLRATLLGVQRVKDGDAFGGGSRPNEDDFEAVDDGADAGDMSEESLG